MAACAINLLTGLCDTHTPTMLVCLHLHCLLSAIMSDINGRRLHQDPAPLSYLMTSEIPGTLLPPSPACSPCLSPAECAGTHSWWAYRAASGPAALQACSAACAWQHHHHHHHHLPLLPPLLLLRNRPLLLLRAGSCSMPTQDRLLLLLPSTQLPAAPQDSLRALWLSCSNLQHTTDAAAASRSAGTAAWDPQQQKLQQACVSQSTCCCCCCW